MKFNNLNEAIEYILKNENNLINEKQIYRNGTIWTK